MNETVKRLRDGLSVRLWDRQNKLFVHFQLNKKESFICWQRFHSKDKRNWVEQNSYLTLRDVMQIRNEIVNKNKNCYK